MKPHYPHRADDAIPRSLTVVDKPSASTVDEIPNLGDLMGAVQEYLKEAQADTARSQVVLNAPGVIFVLCNGEGDAPFAGWERAEVLNGSLKHGELSRTHTQWLGDNAKKLKAERSPKLQTADPKFVYGRDGAIMGCAATPAMGGSTNGQWDNVSKRIMINAHVERGGMLVHEYLHTFDHWDPTDIGWGLDEGFVEFFARDLTARHGYLYRGNWAYQGGYLAVKSIVEKIGLDRAIRFWFLRPADLMGLVGLASKKIGATVVPNEPWKFTPQMIDEFCAAAQKWSGW
jgi:hypothetical protein